MEDLPRWDGGCMWVSLPKIATITNFLALIICIDTKAVYLVTDRSSGTFSRLILTRDLPKIDNTQQ